MTPSQLYAAAVAAGIPTDHHDSDLYLKATPEARALVEQFAHKRNVTTFVSAIDGAEWLDVPFAYQPYWDAKQAQAERGTL